MCLVRTSDSSAAEPSAISVCDWLDMSMTATSCRKPSSLFLLSFIVYVGAASLFDVLNARLVTHVDAVHVYVDEVAVRVQQTNNYIGDDAQHLNVVAQALYRSQMHSNCSTCKHCSASSTPVMNTFTLPHTNFRLQYIHVVYCCWLDVDADTICITKHDPLRFFSVFSTLQVGVSKGMRLVETDWVLQQQQCYARKRPTQVYLENSIFQKNALCVCYGIVIGLAFNRDVSTNYAAQILSFASYMLKEAHRTTKTTLHFILNLGYC